MGEVILVLIMLPFAILFMAWADSIKDDKTEDRMNKAIEDAFNRRESNDNRLEMYNAQKLGLYIRNHRN
jgi:hypothetical protein